MAFFFTGLMFGGWGNIVLEERAREREREREKERERELKEKQSNKELTGMEKGRHIDR